MTCYDEARNQARGHVEWHRIASQEQQQRPMTAWNPDQSESDLRTPAKPPFPSLNAVYLRFRAVLTPPTCPSAPPSSCPSALPRLSIAWLANSLQTPPQIPHRFPHIQHERSIFDNERYAQHCSLHPPFTIPARRRSRKRTRDRALDAYARPSFACFQVVVGTAPCHPERSERSSPPPVILSATNASAPLSSRAKRTE